MWIPRHTHFPILRTTVKLHFQTQCIDSSQLMIIEHRIFSIDNLDSCSTSRWEMVENACLRVCVSPLAGRRRIEKDTRGFNKGLEIDGHPWAVMAIYDASCIIIIFHDTRNRRYSWDSSIIHLDRDAPVTKIFRLIIYSTVPCQYR